MGKGLMITPEGSITGFVAIEKPSTKFDVNGIYSCQVSFEGEDAKSMRDNLDSLMAASHDAGIKKGIKSMANPPYTTDGDQLIAKFKQKAQIISKNGETFEMNIKLYDIKGVLLKEEMYIAPDSIVKVAFSSYAWSVASLGNGITLQPVCIQIIKLVKYQGGNSNPFVVENEPFSGDDGDIVQVSVPGLIGDPNDF